MPGFVTFGTFAEYINIETKFVAPKPSNMSWSEAAGVPLAGQTSWQALVTYGKLQQGQRVLILGGSSGTGVFAIQIAKALGAEVITTCSGRNVELVKSLGADQIVDYTKEKWSEVLAEHSIDLIYDCGMEPASWNDAAQKVLKEKTGIFVTILTVDKPIESPIGATLHQIFNAPCTEYLVELKKLIEAGKVKTVIDSVHPLENAMEAFKVQMSSRARGKIIIEIAKDLIPENSKFNKRQSIQHFTMAIPETFKVYQYESYGEDPLNLIKLNPSAAQKPLHATEVRVKVFSAALNPIDYKVIQYGPALLSTKPTPKEPFRLGFDLAGKIVELGSAVSAYNIGDEVYAMPLFDAMGSVGEYINVDAKFVALKPTNISGTGVFGIQIAKAVGAEVITTCSARNTELVKALGADQVIDYTKDKWSDVLAEHSVDLIYDCGCDGGSWNDVAQKIMKAQTGIFVTISSVGVNNPNESPIGAILHQIINAPCTDFLVELKKLAETDQLKTVIDSVHPLENTPDAMKICMSQRARGKVIIEVAKE
ncbi:Alcohol dehydrogenase [Phytophthora megakarya]|uniref:Alcohol dehydrogenase n=1 Tax=Phytophthora megakarya TaxID=4795 RepID=A0A225V6H3_9STRA|nr:Alcohol dehydrogenase [Phytophthora megakarya]